MHGVSWASVSMHGPGSDVRKRRDEQERSSTVVAACRAAEAAMVPVTDASLQKSSSKRRAWLCFEIKVLTSCLLEFCKRPSSAVEKASWMARA